MNENDANWNDVAPAELRCDICGVKGNAKASPFRTRRDLLTHRALAHRGTPPRVETVYKNRAAICRAEEVTLSLLRSLFGTDRFGKPPTN